jgi:anaerobic magnesium-protoporphyrin IX monomethyl ester cyclase
MNQYDFLLLDYRGVSYDDLNYYIHSQGYHINVEKSFSGTIAYLVTYLQRRGLTCDFLLSMEDYNEILQQKCSDNQYHCIGISTTLCKSVNEIRDCIRNIRAIQPHTPIVIGGAYIAKYIKELEVNERYLKIMLKSIGADFYVNSFEGERALYDLIVSIKGNYAYRDIPNICYLEDGRIIINDTASENNDLSQNTVDWRLFGESLGALIPIRTSVSCPYSCSYCSYPVNAGAFRYIPVEKVEQELNTLDRIGSVKHVFFIDDTFNIPKQRFKDMLRMLIKNRYSFKWHSYLRCQLLDEEDVFLMKESGCEGVLLGIESGSQTVLDNMNKHVKVDAIKSGLELLKRAEITTLGMFIIGFPGETEETLAETQAFINSQPISFYMIQPWFYDPRTPIGAQKEKYNLQGQYNKWSHNTMNSQQAGQFVQRIIKSEKNNKFCFGSEPLFQLLDNSVGITHDEIEKMMLSLWARHIRL